MLEAGTILQNRYQILKPIGRGGMGAVYLASDQRLGSTVALKETLFDDPVLLSAFKREARLLASLKHEALPKVTDHFADGEGHFLVMEFIVGDDLEDMLKKRDIPFQVDEALGWATQLLDALDYLHSQNPPVIHRDIKPQNLKLTSRNRIVLLDFGLAKGAASGMSVTGPTTSIFGYTPSYAPLEQIQGSGTDSRSDLYSLAATVYHLLTNTRPIDALTRATTVVNGQADPLAPASEVNPHIPDSVSRVLMQAMALKRDERPSSAAEMRRLLCDSGCPATEPSEAFQKGDTAPARPDPSTQARTYPPTIPNKAIADPVTQPPLPSADQKRPATYHRGNTNRPPVAAPPQWPSPALRDQTDSNRGKWIAAAAVFIIAVAVLVYALKRDSNTANAIQTTGNSNAQVKDFNQPDANAKTPSGSADSNPGAWPSAIRQTPKEDGTSPVVEDNATSQEQGQETEQPEKRAEASPEPEKTEAAKSQPARGQEGADREDRPPPPPPPPPPGHGPPPDGPPPGHGPPPPPRRRP